MKPAKVYQLTITGKDLRNAIRKLKPAFPRKKDMDERSVVISASSGKATFSTLGAAVEIPGESNGVFTAEIPFIEFKMIMDDPYTNKEELRFEFSRGSLTFRGITTKSSDILVKRGKINPGTLPPKTPVDPPKSFINPIDTPMGMPLLGAYAYMKQYGFRPTVANRTFAEQQAEVLAILDRAEKLLEPLGIGRDDLEVIIDRKLGL